MPVECQSPPPDVFVADYQRLLNFLVQVVKETHGEPSLIMFDGKPYKLIPESLADEIVSYLTQRQPPT